MRRSIISVAILAVLAGLSAPAMAQNPTAAGAASGAATGGRVAGPVGSFVGGVTGAAVGTAGGIVDAVTSPFRPRHRYEGRRMRRTTCVTRPNGTRRCRTVRY
ncbi:hypothetical protein [Lichenifustis flavocetrariae]|uniref:Glycine zipper domain-containing protein n=1 Tax=Lichenifustis flavocetrariae TaxID=2949735 RepID=A0AA42CKE7_9HYPH|nr:hypothetical protein [Lichenifustis flavocetrariae]MCW6510503.1 hypothetical protein [Lichenifustis flavocetrariae]